MPLISNRYGPPRSVTPPKRMYNILCTLPLASDLLDLAIHPSSPLLALALASGHVQLLRIPPPGPSSPTIATVWRARRHKEGGCRAVAFAEEGKYVISAGCDGLVKIADTGDGRVKGKIAVPRVPSPKGNGARKRKRKTSAGQDGTRDGANVDEEEGVVDPSAGICVLSGTKIVVATDGGMLHVYEYTAGQIEMLHGAKPTRTVRDAHPEAHVTSIIEAGGDNLQGGGDKGNLDGAKANVGKLITTGGGTVAVVDVKKGAVAMETEPVEELLLSSAGCCGKVFVGGEEGRLRVWDMGAWGRESIYNVQKGSGIGIDVMACVEEVSQHGGALLALGREDGSIRFVDVRNGKAKTSVKVRPDEINHNDLDGVVGLGWLRDGRLVSGGGEAIKIWERTYGAAEDAVELGVQGRAEDSDSEDSANDSDEDAASSDEDEQPRKRRRKKSKGNAKANNGILKFNGLG